MVNTEHVGAPSKANFVPEYPALNSLPLHPDIEVMNTFVPVFLSLKWGSIALVHFKGQIHLSRMHHGSLGASVLLIIRISISIGRGCG